jgi:uncharacterized Zn-binding protein involved in type VI secretion
MKLINIASRLTRIAGLAAFGITAILTTQIAQAAECQYAVVDEWAQGFKAEVSIVNTGEPINDWQLSWALGSGTTFNNGWNATYACSAGNCVATPPAWKPLINTGQTYTFGFIADKSGNAADRNVVVNGAICDNTPIIETANVSWQLQGASSSVHYVSMKKDHVAEVNTFVAAAGEPAALSGSITNTGEVVFAIDLNDVATGVDIRNSRLLSLLFETELLPTAYFHTNIDVAALAEMSEGAIQFTTLDGNISLHGIRQAVTADVIIVKKTATEISVATVKPVQIDSKQFDMAGGIEALRVVANLSTIGEVVPIYFQLNYAANADVAVQPTSMPAAPQDPTSLVGRFDDVTTQATLNWLDNSTNETGFLVRRKPIGGHWKTVSALSANKIELVEALPDIGEYDYKVIALNQGVPSLATNVERVTITEGNQLARGQHLYQEDCAGCHGVSGEGLSGFPALDTERDIGDMIDYIVNYMPPNNPGSCDQQCAEDLAVFIQTLWKEEAVCDLSLTPVSYGARQLKILTRSEYQNSVEDLLGVDYQVSDGLSADTKVSLFTNNTYAAIVPSSYSNYLLVAEEIATWSAERNFSPALSCTSYNQDCADQFMDTLAPSIFRRPLTDDEIAAYQDMANGTHTNGDVKLGIQNALEGMLSSPQFLYRHELGTANPSNSELDGDAFELTSYEMATFLAYTFTGSTPDQVLLDAAAQDELRTEANIVSQAQRLAGNAKQVMSDFVGSWLGTADLPIAVKDTNAWPGFADIVPHMQSEINETFSNIMISPTEQFASLYSGNYTYLNEALAQHYGINGVTGNTMQRVDTVDRGGILANGAFMARWAEAEETSPILRSVRVRRRMLCQEQPDPPAGTFAAREEKLAELSSFLQDAATTNRMKYHRLTEDAPCTNCHLKYINPLGFGMEDFDTVGRIRNSDLNGNSVDASGALYAPLNYSDVDELETFLGTRGLGTVLSGLPSAQSCLPKQMFRYFLGVGHESIDNANPDGPQLSDDEKAGYACEIEQLTEAMMNNSPRAMLERFGTLKAVRYRKAWSRN